MSMRDRGLAATWSAIAALGLALAFIVPAGAVGQGGGTTPPAPILTVHNTATNATASAIPATSCASGYATPWGDCLRGPWTPYPATPTKAADGLDFGAVGTVGPIGQVGPHSYSPGSAKIIGATPNSTAGRTTYVNNSSYWGNETISLGGNVTIKDGVSLTIQGCTVTFSETTAGTSYSYGLNQSSIFGTLPKVLRISNSTLEVDSMAHNGFWMNQRFAFYSAIAVLDNDTIVQGVGSPTKSVDTTGGVGPAETTLIVATWTNHTSYNGGGNFNATFYTASNRGSAFSNGFVSLIDGANSTSNRVRAVIGTSYHETFSNLTTAYSGTFNGGTALEATLFINDNMSQAYTAGLGTWTTWANDTFANVSFSSGVAIAPSLASNFDHLTFDNCLYLANDLTEISVSAGHHLRYSLFSDVYSDTQIDAEPVGVRSPSAPSTATISDNLFVGWYHRILQAPGPYVSMFSGSLTGNFFMNFNLTAVQTHGYYANVYDNTFVNFHSAGVQAMVTPSAGTGPTHNTNVSGNTVYGLYNSSWGFSSGATAGGFNISYEGNAVYDADISSTPFYLKTSSDTLGGYTGPLSIDNTNGTTIFGLSSSLYPFFTTAVNLNGDNITSLCLAQVIGDGDTTWQTAGIVPTEFNITADDSYLPGSFCQASPESAVTYPSHGLGNFGYGATYVHSSPYPNPSFLDLTGYLGVYTGQTYYINSSNVKSESSLPIRLYSTGNQIASIPQAAGNGWLYTLSVTSASSYQVGVNSSRAPPVTLSFSVPIPNAQYEVYLEPTGSNTSYPVEQATSSSDPSVNVTYTPSTEPLSSLFYVAYVGPNLTGTPPCNAVCEHINLELVLAGVGVISVIALAVIILGNERKSRGGGRRI